MVATNDERLARVERAAIEQTKMVMSWLRDGILTPIEILGLLETQKSAVHKWVAGDLYDDLDAGSG